MQIHEYEERLRLAMLQSDVAELELLIDDELLFVGPQGGIHTKTDDLQLHRSGAQRLSRAQWRAIEVRRFGTTCITVTVVTAELSGTVMGESFSGLFRYVRTWVQRGEAWRVVAGSVVMIEGSEA